MLGSDQSMQARGPKMNAGTTTGRWFTFGGEAVVAKAPNAWRPTITSNVTGISVNWPPAQSRKPVPRLASRPGRAFVVIRARK